MGTRPRERVLTTDSRAVNVPSTGKSPRRIRLNWRSALWGFCAALILSGGFFARDRVLEFAEQLSPTPPEMERDAGLLFLVGGGALPDRLRREFVDLAGGATARLVVIPGDSDGALNEAQTWRALGAAHVSVLHAESRSQADDAEFSKALQKATGVWLGGGQQTWFTAWYRNTLVEERLKEVLARGGVVGGTSAGASAVTTVMVAGGKRDPVEGRGLGLIDGVIVDQHFLKRNRTGRMLKLLSRHPDQIGLGIDEGTAVVVELKTGNLRVFGQSYVLACVPTAEGVLDRLEVLKAGDTTSLEDLRNHSSDPVPAWVGEVIVAD